MIYKNVLEKFLKEQAMKNALEQQKQASMQQMQMDENAMLQQTMMKAGGINIDPSKKGTFKAQATRMGMSVQEAARTILNAPEGKYSPEMRRKANFARNFAKEEGGELIFGNPTSPEEWGKQIKEIEAQIGNPSSWSLDDYNLLQNKLYEYKNWRENTPEGRAVKDSHNVPGEYDVPLPEHLRNYTNAMMKSKFAYANEFGVPAANMQFDSPADAEFYSENYGNIAPEFKKGGQMIRRADGSYSQRGFWDNIRDNIGSGKKPTKEMLAMERKLSQKNDGGEMFGGDCPDGYYFDVSVENCVPIPENVNGRSSSEFNPQSLQEFLERSSQRDFDLKSAQERVLASTQSMADLEAQLQAEKQNVERKRQSIYQNAMRTAEEQERLQKEKPAQYQRAREIYSGENATPATYLKSIQTIDPEILRTMPYDGKRGFIYSDPTYSGLACSSGVCTVVNESGIPIGDIAGNPKLVQKLKSDPRFQVYTTEDIDPETGQRYIPLPGDIVSKTGYAPVNYRNPDLGMTIRPHDAAIVGKVLPDDNPNDAARPYLLYGNEGAALDFGANKTTLYNPSLVKKNPEETGDYGTFIRYVGGLKGLRSKISEEEALKKQYEQKLLDTEANMIVGLPALSPKIVSSEMQVPEPQFRSFQETYAQRLQDIENSDMSKREKKRAIKNAQETAAIIQQMASNNMTQVRRKGGTVNPVGLSKFLGML